MNSKPVISIVTPAFRHAEFITKTMESIMSQKGDFYIDYQVFDADSKDGTEAHLTRIFETWNQGQTAFEKEGIVFKTHFANPSWNQCLGISFRYVIEKDKGQSDAINKGWARMIGDYYAYLNSDDIYYPEAFQTVCEVANQDPDSDVFYGHGIHIDTNDHVYDLYPTEAFQIDRMTAHCGICQPTVFLRRTIYTDFGGVDTDLHFCMDYEYWLRLRHKKFHLIEKVLAATRLHLNAKTISQAPKIMREICYMQKRVLGHASNHWISCWVEQGLLSSNPRSANLAPSTYTRQILGQFYRLKCQWILNRKIALAPLANMFKITLDQYVFRK